MYDMIKRLLCLIILFFVVNDCSSVYGYTYQFCFMLFSTAAVEASVVALAIHSSYVVLVSFGFGDPVNLGRISAEKR